MNKLKSNARILLIIIVAAFVIVPVVSILLSRTIGIHEGMSDYDMTDKNVSMDRINMAGVGFTNKNDDSATGGTEDYLYCIGGDIECEDSTDTLVEDTEGATYDDVNGNSHKSYSASCESGSSAVCTNNYVSTTSDNSVTFVDSNGTQTSLYGPSDTLFSGFLGPYNYIPLKIDDNYVYLYDSANGDFSSEANSACHLYGDCPSADATDSATTTDSDSATATDSDSATSTSSQSIKCLADNGAKAGDPLCCGQDGVVQNTKYNCPSEYPYCIGYKCGESWGKCSKTSAE